MEPQKLTPEQQKKKRGWKNIGLIALCIFIPFCVIFSCIAIALIYDSNMEKENTELKEKNKFLVAENDSLKSLLTELQETDNYYYQQAINSRNNKKFKKSNEYLEILIDRFPKSPLKKDANSIIKKNNDDLAEDLYDLALTAQLKEQFAHANNLVEELLSKYPKSQFAAKAKKLKKETTKKIKEEEKETAKKIKEEEEALLRQGADLELISWNWGRSYGGSYVEGRGQVKNISDAALRNVEAVVNFYDKNGDFITSGSALIEFNPVLVGQISPFTVMETYNPAMKGATIQFKYLMGGTIPTYKKKK